MKKACLGLALLILFSLIPFSIQAREVLLRVNNSFGLLGRLTGTGLENSVKHFVFLHPEGHVEFQISGPLYLTGSLYYAYIRGTRGDHMDMLAYAGGLKAVSFADTEGVGDFFDRTRWWFGLEAGSYATRSRLNTAAVPRDKQADFGFNIGGGFDSFFHRHWAAGFQVKMHYVHYNPDDYLMTTLGPNLVYRF